jgi:hypothetical protein
MEKTAATGWDTLVVTSAGLEEIAQLIIASAEALGRDEALEAAHIVNKRRCKPPPEICRNSLNRLPELANNGVPIGTGRDPTPTLLFRRSSVP